MTTEEKAKLPDTLHDLLELALEDLKKCMKSDKYNINMSNWMVNQTDDRCSVCMAGAVMAQTEGVDENVFTPRNKKYNAIDSLRCGLITSAYEDLHGELPEQQLKRFNPCSFYVDEDAFIEGMNEILDYLKEENI